MISSFSLTASSLTSCSLAAPLAFTITFSAVKIGSSIFTITVSINPGFSDRSGSASGWVGSSGSLLSYVPSSFGFTGLSGSLIAASAQYRLFASSSVLIPVSGISDVNAFTIYVYFIVAFCPAFYLYSSWIYFQNLYFYLFYYLNY